MSSLEEVLAEASAWADGAAWGDDGQQPSFELYWNNKKREWHAHAESFYDGCGSGQAESPEEAVRLCLAGLRESPDRERAASRKTLVGEMARYLRCSLIEAERRLATIEEVP